jgi:ParB family chromosome partitioning protein
MAARNRSIKAKEVESAAKLMTAFVREAHEGTIGKLIVEAVILLSAMSQSEGGKVLRAAYVRSSQCHFKHRCIIISRFI